MTTLNVNAVEMVNNSVESNNTIMGNIEELTKRSCNSSTAESR